MQPPKPVRATDTGSGAHSEHCDDQHRHAVVAVSPDAVQLSMPSAHFSSTRSSMNDLSSLSHTPVDPPAVLRTASTTSSRAITAIISSSSNALSAPTFPAPPLASLTVGALHPKESISSSVESTGSSQSADSILQPLLAAKRSPLLSSRTGAAAG